MEDTVKGSVLKKIGVNLARFADVRETAKEPRDRIVVQADGRAMKFIAGGSLGTLVATAHATSEVWRAIIPARSFLQAIKNTSAKQEYQITNLNRGFEIGCTLVGNGDEVDFLRLTQTLPRLMLPPTLDAQNQGSIPFSEAELKEVGPLLLGVSDEPNHPVLVAGKIYTKENSIWFAATNGIRYAKRKFGGTYEIFGTIDAGWLDASREIGEAAMFFWTDGKVTLENDTYRSIGPYAMLEGSYIPLEFKPASLEQVQYKAVVERNALVKQVREHQRLDNYQRVVLQYTEDGIKVKPFETGKHGWFVRGENLLKVLTALSAKQVGIGFRVGERQPINVRIPEWTIEVAPVALSTSK